MPANYNYSGQTVISGTKQAMELAKKDLQQKGAKKLVTLKTSGPFHTEKLSMAKEKYEKEKESFIKEFKESSDPEIVATFKSIFVSGRFDKLNDASETQPFEDIDDELE